VSGCGLVLLPRPRHPQEQDIVMTIHSIPADYHDRILDVARRLGADLDTCTETIHAIPAAEPTRLHAALTTVLPVQVVVTGTLERRLLLAQHAERDQWIVADLAGQAHRTRAWPSWARAAIQLGDESDWISTAHISPAGVHRLTRPTVLLAALYHPEYFRPRSGPSVPTSSGSPRPSPTRPADHGA
jgi:hypothetical protein